MLSGGLDSSSIVGMAEDLRRRMGGPTVRPFSMTFPGRPCDEGHFVRAVNEMWELSGESLGDVPMDWVSSAHAEVGRYLDIPALPNNTAADPIRMVARAQGVRVLPFGLGGDEWLRGSPAYYADLFRRGRLISLVRQVRLDQGDTDFVGFTRAARLAVWPFVPRLAKQAIKRLVNHDLLPDWLDRRFVQRTGLRGRLERFRPYVRFKEAAKTDAFTEASSGQVTLALEHLDRSLAWLGLEARHPFHDRRLIEFALAVPSKQHWWGGYSKSLLRRAMRELLPPAVRERRWAPNYWHLMNGALTAHAQAGSFVPKATAALGWLEPAAFRAQAERLMPAILQGDRRRWPSVWPLWSACAIELWARGTLQGAM
jgi:asparagine synthase (glutamine-hydrolysing)